MFSPPVALYRLARAGFVLAREGVFSGVEIELTPPPAHLPLRLAGMLILPVPAAAAQGALALGSGCRVCPREACPARREPSVMSEFALAA